MTKTTSGEDLQQSGDLIWYLAYGSNISIEKFTGGRGIVPLATARVQVPGWILAFNIPGLPYSEPTFTSIISRLSDSTSQYSTPDVSGVAYLITEDQYVRVIASEGGGIAYNDIEVHAVPLEQKDAEVTGPCITARTLGAAIERNPWPMPSRRYMDIILTGCKEVQMPEVYREYLESVDTYEPPEDRQAKIGAAIFLSFWGPVMGIMEKITHATTRKDGYAPIFVIWLVRFTMYLIWFTHDYIFAPLFGRGDGNVKEEDVVVNEKQALLSQHENTKICYSV